MRSLTVNPGLFRPSSNLGVGHSCPFLSRCGGCHVPDCGSGCDNYSMTIRLKAILDEYLVEDFINLQDLMGTV